MPVAKTIAGLPQSYGCRACRKEKPVAEMMVVFVRRAGHFRLRPRCKDCHNARERGHRREWKRNYLRRWRAYNSELNTTYWRQRIGPRGSAERARHNAAKYAHFQRNHHAILIQSRLRRRLGQRVSLDEARALLRQFGPAYPTPQGLTPKGKKEYERIRGALRRIGQKPNPVEIRVMLYADGHYIKPSRQPVPYQKAAASLRAWHARNKAAQHRRAA